MRMCRRIGMYALRRWCPTRRHRFQFDLFPIAAELFERFVGGVNGIRIAGTILDSGGRRDFRIITVGIWLFTIFV